MHNPEFVFRKKIGVRGLGKRLALEVEELEVGKEVTCNDPN